MQPGDSRLLCFEGFTLDLKRGCLRRDGGEIELRPKSFELLRYLAENAGRLVAKDELVQVVWPSVVVADESLTRCVSDVRRALGDAEQRIIKTVPRRGYLLAATVSEPEMRTAPERVPIDKPALALPDKPSIAVLPFENLSRDPEQEYFADGVVEEIITALSRMRWLFVISRHSSFTYKGRAVEVKQVGGELGVRYVLGGSVRKAGNRLRIAGQLIDATTGTHLWADRFEGELGDIFDLQDRVTASVIGAIAPTLEKVEIERAKRKPAESLDAYDYYLRGLATGITSIGRATPKPCASSPAPQSSIPISPRPTARSPCVSQSAREIAGPQIQRMRSLKWKGWPGKWRDWA